MRKKRKENKENFVSRYDPNGMYTGNSLDGERPIQDADDL